MDLEKRHKTLYKALITSLNDGQIKSITPEESQISRSSCLSIVKPDTIHNKMMTVASPSTSEGSADSDWHIASTGIKTIAHESQRRRPTNACLSDNFDEYKDFASQAAFMHIESVKWTRSTSVISISSDEESSNSTGSSATFRYEEDTSRPLRAQSANLSRSSMSLKPLIMDGRSKSDIKFTHSFVLRSSLGDTDVSIEDEFTVIYTCDATSLNAWVSDLPPQGCVLGFDTEGNGVVTQLCSLTTMRILIFSMPWFAPQVY